MTGLSHIAQSERSDLEALEAERDEAVERAELLEVERDELLNERKVLRTAIAAHRVALLSRDWGTSAKAADEELWAVLDR